MDFSLVLNLLRYISVALGAVYVGYTLQPIPKVLDNLFKTSQVFKLVCVVVFLLNVMGKLTVNALLVALVAAVVVLSLFEYLRVFDQEVVVEKKQL
jgi:hypothetical protein